MFGQAAMKKIKIFTPLFLLTVSCIALISISKVTYAADNSNSSNALPLLQSYSARSDIYPGMLVYDNPESSDSVLALKDININKMLGVVVPINNAQISLSPLSSNSNSQQVLVAESGSYDVLVSNENGNIVAGNNLTMSSLAGVAMKAGSSNQLSIGQAEGNFNGKTNVIDATSIKNNSGKRATYAIGSILVNVHLSHNSLYSQPTSGLPQFITQAAYTIARKPVDPIRIYLSFAVMFGIIILVGVMFYSGVRNGIISIGRNPLSQKSITRGLMQTIVAGLLVFGIGLALIYVIVII